ncbi:hypothetical protein RB195_004339 [Necator americanus]|uniref:Peptidase M12A domain-containing protein n=1 Tax=Necator americanus TaxID=51031 RepID=A0ABR1BHI3_NECAM
MYVGTATHEIGHALGFWHTQSRHDRDRFITLDASNIKVIEFGSQTVLKYRVAPDDLTENTTKQPKTTGSTTKKPKASSDCEDDERSSVALGQAKDGAGGRAPKAAKMKKMAYDCEVEKTAMNNAKQCVFKHSQPNQRKGLGENIFMSSNSGMDKAKAAEQASKAWFGELAEQGVGRNLKLTGGLFSRGVGHYTQMVWQETVKLGCYVQTCPKMCYVVCQYGPAGNMMGKDIYEKGEPCSKCENCDKEKGLCSA